MWIRKAPFVLGAAVALLGSAACKKAQDAPKTPAATPTAVAPTPAATPTAAAPIPAPTSQPAAPSPAAAAVNASADGAALAFFKAQIVACNEWNVKVKNSQPGEKYFDGTAKDPTRTLQIVGRPAPGQFVVEDADKTQLLIDLPKQRITAPAGPGAALPVRYKFCSEKVFVGTGD